MVPQWFVSATACKLLFAYVFNGLMDVDEVVPGKSIACLCIGEGTQQKQQQCPQVGPLHHIEMERTLPPN